MLDEEQFPSSTCIFTLTLSKRAALIEGLFYIRKAVEIVEHKKHSTVILIQFCARYRLKMSEAQNPDTDDNLGIEQTGKKANELKLEKEKTSMTVKC